MPTHTSQNIPRPGRLSPAEAHRRLQHEHRARLVQLENMRERRETTPEDLLTVQRAAVRRVIEDIEAALDRLKDGEYGSCQRCNRPIPVERLELLPYARCCVGCQQRTR
jgi:DnaK suppressor protein